MTLSEFNLLNEETKLGILLTNGECIGYRKEADSCIFLYQLFSFYVEEHSACAEGYGILFRSFSSIDELQPYLEEIDISDLLEGKK